MPRNAAGGQLKYRVAALTLIAVCTVLGWTAVEMYNQRFTPFTHVTLRADRAGLQMHPGNRVKFQGVDLGKVDSVSLAQDGRSVTLGLSLFPDAAKRVPANAAVSLEQLTAFGNKTVQLSYPQQPSNETLHEGSQLSAGHVSVEANTVFEHLADVLSYLPADKLSATLGAFAQALQGRGDKIGDTVVVADNYLRQINADLPAIQRDARSAATFSNLYADVTPDLIKILGNVTITSQTLTDRRQDLAAALTGASDLGAEGQQLFSENATPLVEALASLRPTTSLLAQYSPELTCVLQGAAKTLDSITPAFTDSGVAVDATLSVGDRQYQYPKDLPRVGPGLLKGPNCRGLPHIMPGEEHLADATPDAGATRADSNTPQLPDRPLVATIFGPQALTPQPGGHSARQTGR
jgi:phospholipid/cholesterol/gamma-HCH transport system substrate-binding protein